LAIIIYYESRTVVHTSHHIEETDAGLDRPLYLRNKFYHKTLKSQNYYSNIVLFPVPKLTAISDFKIVSGEEPPDPVRRGKRELGRVVGKGR